VMTIAHSMSLIADASRCVMKRPAERR